jgi:hypothetical protein
MTNKISVSYRLSDVRKNISYNESTGKIKGVNYSTIVGETAKLLLQVINPNIYDP